MANFAKLIIQFTSETSSQGAELKIRWNNGGNIDRVWSAEDLRTIAFTYTISIVDEIEQTTFCFDAVSADIANDGTLSPVMNVTKTATDTFEIEATEFGWTIEDNGTTLDVEATLTEVPEVLPVKDFQLTGFSLATAVLPCANIQVTITENDGVPTYTWISPANASTTLVADIARAASDQLITVILEDSEADQASLANVTIPRLFTAVEISDISVVANAGGLDATVTIFMATQDFGTYQFSLGGSNFQTSNVFPNIVDGAYTLYVDDGYGCIISQGFTVDVSASVQRANPNATVPTANSMRMIQRTTSRFSNLDNTLYQNESFTNEDKKAYAQLYQTNDGVIPTQIKTNYDQPSARIVDCDGNTIQTLDVIQKSDNIDARDSRDLIAFNFGDNQTGLYFTQGNLYDPGTTDIIGSYELNGKLPDWGEEGNTVILTGGVVGSFIIKQVVFDSTVRAETLVIDNTWTSGNETEAAIADVTYDRQEFEIWEFEVDTASLSAGVYSNELLLVDSLGDYETLAFDSEQYHIKTTHRKTLWIDYDDSPGTGIDYTTGYIGHVRLTGQPPGYDPSYGGPVTVFSDSGENLQKVADNPTRGGVAFFHQQPRYMTEKLRLIFAHLNYAINGESFQNEEEFEFLRVPMSSLNNAQIQVRKVDYEAYRDDNIQIDGDSQTLDQQDDEPILI